RAVDGIASYAPDQFYRPAVERPGGQHQAQFITAKPAMGNRDVALPGQLDRPGHELEKLVENEPGSPCFSPRTQLESPFAFDPGRDDPQVHHALLAHADLLVR